MRGRLHREVAPRTLVDDLERLAKIMIGKSITIDELEIGKIISAEVAGDFIEWEAEEYHSSKPKVKE